MLQRYLDVLQHKHAYFNSDNVQAGALLPSAPARRDNLPASLTTLLGRTEEVAQIGALLRRAEVRLVTLTSPGGVGKSRLAEQVVKDLLDAFADGVFLIRLGRNAFLSPVSFNYFRANRIAGYVSALVSGLGAFARASRRTAAQLTLSIMTACSPTQSRAPFK
jgi:hypothetical protein